MSALVFDATKYAPNDLITVTVSKSHTAFTWDDRREFAWPQLKDVFATAETGIKNGSCYTPAVFSGKLRRMDAATEISIAVLDSDCGHTLTEIESAIVAKKWRGIIHSTYSHLTDTSIISKDAFDKWQTATGGNVAAYMLEKKGYLPYIVKNAEISDIDSTGKNYIVKHAPCPKFRVILPLDKPWRADAHETQQVACAVWAERIGALAASLGLHHDQSCTDTSRLFYFPRIRASARYEYRAMEGDLCPLFELPDAPSRAAPSATLFDAAPQRIAPIDNSHKIYQEPGGAWLDLTDWAALYAPRFEIVTALKARAPGVLGARRGVKYHLVCPNADSHTTDTTSATGTFAVNASELDRAALPGRQSGFVLHCLHNGCSAHDRLDHLSALLARGSLSLADLTDPAYLVPDAYAVDVSALTAPEAANHGNVSPALYTALPGVLGEIHGYICATSPKPQPVLALGASLALMAAAVGQRVKLERWHTRPNIYAIGVAYSGAGKDRCLTAVRQMAKSAGLLDKLIGPEDLASDSGLVSAVFKAPRGMGLFDEVSGLIASTNNRSSGPHLVGITTVLLKLYSASSSVYKSKSYADSDKTRVIDQPCVSIFGCCTPSGLAKSLSAEDVQSGLLSRAVLFDAGDHDPYQQPPQNRPTPPGVVAWLRAWDAVTPIANPLARDGGDPVLEPRTVHLTDDAAHLADQFGREMHAAKIAARESNTDAVYVRALENALKFALLRACAAPAVTRDGVPHIDETTLRVDAEAMRWAVDLSRATVQSMAQMAREDVASGDFDRAAIDLRKAVDKAGARGATMRDIARMSAGRRNKRDLDALLERLTTAEAIALVTMPNDKAAPRVAYVAKRFLRKVTSSQ